MDDREEQLRQRAYGIWQSEGEPHGRDRDHWERAERELTELPPEEPAVAPKPTANRRKKPASAPQTIAAEETESKPKARKPRAKTA
ncbi:DUF2934 domain-containing protein [Sphingomonas fuzhouensis]|uniref:DUF2934 domain-containing protein n=1 Tax=Sphingomonas fuzhouensis TaxID=3106033 RepID=UPI002AFDDA80|nr:DUF2934 domain-containing protein [Sphingomonas sp. SGZ-02]